MSESVQMKLTRLRRPRVHITYNVETNGAIEKVELPFVIGVLADLSGNSKKPLRPFRQRKAVAIDRGNFNDILAKAMPRVVMQVSNRLTNEDTKLAVELNFKEMKDFDPAEVARQVGPLAKLLKMRHELSQLLGKMEACDSLKGLLTEVMGNQEAAMKLAREMGLAPSGTPAPDVGK